jgi:hypothetical protein
VLEGACPFTDVQCPLHPSTGSVVKRTKIGQQKRTRLDVVGLEVRDRWDTSALSGVVRTSAIALQRQSARICFCGNVDHCPHKIHPPFNLEMVPVLLDTGMSPNPTIIVPNPSTALKPNMDDEDDDDTIDITQAEYEEERRQEDDNNAGDLDEEVFGDTPLDEIEMHVRTLQGFMRSGTLSAYALKAIKFANETLKHALLELQ